MAMARNIASQDPLVHQFSAPANRSPSLVQRLTAIVTVCRVNAMAVGCAAHVYADFTAMWIPLQHLVVIGKHSCVLERVPQYDRTQMITPTSANMLAPD